MWIAKPLPALSAAERGAWIAAQEARTRQGEDVPLSQSLLWAEATQALGAKTWLVMNAEEKAGGIVHLAESAGVFECTNGPLIDWESPERAPRQLATFATAVARLSRDFQAMRLRPRLLAEQVDRCLGHLPIKPFALAQASTLMLAVAPNADEQRARISPRLRRTLSRADRAGVRTSWQVLEPGGSGAPGAQDALASFAHGVSEFGRKRGFYVPPRSWFEALLKRPTPVVPQEGFRFHLARAEGSGSVTSLMICERPGLAYFLYGYDERDREAPSWLSTAVSAQFRVLEECAREGLGRYDLGGFVETEGVPAPERDSGSYAGVAGFKAQLGGEVVRYRIPEFRIS